MYGLESEESADVPAAKREEVTREVFKLFDVDKNGVIEKDEWMDKSGQGVRLPDFGLGPGHHGDDEYEYEIHHFERFHGEGRLLFFPFPGLLVGGFPGLWLWHSFVLTWNRYQGRGPDAPRGHRTLREARSRGRGDGGVREGEPEAYYREQYSCHVPSKGGLSRVENVGKPLGFRSCALLSALGKDEQ